MDNAEFKSLLVQNIGDLDITCKRLQDLEKEVFDGLSETVKSWAEEHNWSANSDYWEDDELWLAKKEWRTEGTSPDENHFDFWFELKVGATDKETFEDPFDYLYTTRLCRAGQGLMGFRLLQHNVVKGRDFKRLCESTAHDFAETPFILDDDRSIFLPVSVSQKRLSDAFLNDDLGLAFSEVATTLDALSQADDKIERLIRAARNATTLTGEAP